MGELYAKLNALIQSNAPEWQVEEIVTDIGMMARSIFANITK